jgi:hypothetical protein
MNTGKHVIFLGAGASKESGYPLADGLRLLISSHPKWTEALKSYDQKHGGGGHIVHDGTTFWSSQFQALDLFRKGGFATLDEFCKLAGGAFRNEVNGLRRLVRAALGLFNPEEHFEDSEYYGFVQSLFEKDLVTLRRDITVLTYNYDPYLEFLLSRALETRWQVTDRGTQPTTDKLVGRDEQRNAATSGFFDATKRDWLEKTKAGFCVLKLHGSICYVADGVAGFEILFNGRAPARAKAFFTDKAHTDPSPILFPWEIMTKDGFADEKLFPHQHSRDLYLLFRGIWDRARWEVQAADKVSFVGLSMHSFLEDGLKFLFDGKPGQAEIVVANPDTPVFDATRRESSHWSRRLNCSGYALSDVLRRFAPRLQRRGLLPFHSSTAPDEITVLPTFKEFVRTQMGPCEQLNEPAQKTPLVETCPGLVKWDSRF